MQKEPNAIHMIFGIATIGWFGYAWNAYMQMGLYGSILALFAGVTFLFVAREAALAKEASWLFGWNDNLVQHAFMRMPVYASIFIGPITRHAVEAVAPDFFAGDKYIIVVMALSIVLGVGMSFFMNSHRNVVDS